MICRHFGVCGGCQWQDVPYPEQLARKRETLQRLFTHALGPAAPHVAPPVGMPTGPDGHPWGFRHKAAFVFGPSPAVMGHYAEGSSTIVPVTECPVHSDRANRLAFALRDRLARARVPHGVVRHVLVRTTADQREAVVMLVVWRNDKSLRAPIRALLASPDAPTGFLVNIHAKPGPYLVGPETIRVAGDAHVREDRTGASLLVAPTAFFQTNPVAAAALVDLVRAAVPEDAGRVLDLYAGSGLFALPLALRGARVTAIEDNAQAVKDGQANARLNRVPAGRVRWLRGRVEDLAGRLDPRPFEAAVLDPPRQGCDPAALDAVFEGLRPPRVVYVSCNPDALAAELPSIARAGYRLVSAHPVDMFPHTPHIEVVAVLDRVVTSSRPSSPGTRESRLSSRGRSRRPSGPARRF
ncbi:MAG: 23S rRNA (uracil(1939)-C(5))-methyltransferase RlmD [Acidobacteriota bacterium]